MQQSFLTERELSQVLKCSVAALRTWRRKNGLPFIKLGRLVRYELRAVLAWFESQKPSVAKEMSS
jgi:excisionase family DNA binding protein